MIWMEFSAMIIFLGAAWNTENSFVHMNVTRTDT
jgi:uncharacterized BrkB/YihY/UPF0761 family membrane protein